MSQQDIADALIEKQGTLFSEEMGIDLAKGTPEATFAWLIGTILLAKRISHDLATRAGRALNEAGLMRVDAVLEASLTDNRTLKRRRRPATAAPPLSNLR